MGAVLRLPIDVYTKQLALLIVDNLHDYVTQLQIALLVSRRDAHGEDTPCFDGHTNPFQPGV